MKEYTKKIAAGNPMSLLESKSDRKITQGRRREYHQGFFICVYHTSGPRLGTKKTSVLQSMLFHIDCAAINN
jgi:hypothetical protein